MQGKNCGRQSLPQLKLSTKCRQLELQKQKLPKKFRLLLIIKRERGIPSPLALSPCSSNPVAGWCLQAELQKQKLPKKFRLLLIIKRERGIPSPLALSPCSSNPVAGWCLQAELREAKPPAALSNSKSFKSVFSPPASSPGRRPGWSPRPLRPCPGSSRGFRRPGRRSRR